MGRGEGLCGEVVSLWQKMMKIIVEFCKKANELTKKEAEDIEFA